MKITDNRPPKAKKLFKHLNFGDVFEFVDTDLYSGVHMRSDSTAGLFICLNDGALYSGVNSNDLYNEPVRLLYCELVIKEEEEENEDGTTK